MLEKIFFETSTASIPGVGVVHVTVSRVIRVRPTSKSSFSSRYFQNRITRHPSVLRRRPSEAISSEWSRSIGNRYRLSAFRRF
jgi:hypothetical protein